MPRVNGDVTTVTLKNRQQQHHEPRFTRRVMPVTTVTLMHTSRRKRGRVAPRLVVVFCSLACIQRRVAFKASPASLSSPCLSAGHLKDAAAITLIATKCISSATGLLCQVISLRKVLYDERTIRSSDSSLVRREARSRRTRFFGLQTHLVCTRVCTAQSEYCAQYIRRDFLKSLRSQDRLT